MRTEREVFEEISRKNYLLIRLLFLGIFVFGGIGSIYAGIRLSMAQEVMNPPLPHFIGFGIILSIIGISLFFILPKKLSYEIICDRIDRYENERFYRSDLVDRCLRARLQLHEEQEEQLAKKQYENGKIYREY